VAERKRRGDDAVEERFDDDVDDLADDQLIDDEPVDDEPVDEAADMFDDDALDDEPDDAKPARRAGRNGGRRASLTKERPTTGGRRPGRTKTAERPNIFARIAMFFREVVAELRKVIWPTRKELLTYTTVVVVFVTIMVIVTSGLDYLVAKAVLWTFANGDKVATK